MSFNEFWYISGESKICIVLGISKIISWNVQMGSEEFITSPSSVTGTEASPPLAFIQWQGQSWFETNFSTAFPGKPWIQKNVVPHSTKHLGQFRKRSFSLNYSVKTFGGKLLSAQRSHKSLLSQFFLQDCPHLQVASCGSWALLSLGTLVTLASLFLWVHLYFELAG